MYGTDRLDELEIKTIVKQAIVKHDQLSRGFAMERKVKQGDNFAFLRHPWGRV